MFNDPSEQPDGLERASKQSSDTTGDKPPVDREQFAHDLNNHGIWLLTTGKVQTAARCFRRACSTFPSLATAWINLASALVMLGKHEEAIVTIRQAAKAGALSRALATRYRNTIREQLNQQFMLNRKHRLQDVRRQVSKPDGKILAPPQEPQVIQPAGLLDTAGFGVFTGYSGLLGA